MLTDTLIKSLKAQSKEYSVKDGRGLFLYVQTTGAKWWRYRFTFDGKEKKISLGVYPDISLAQARELCERNRKLVASGVNPSEKRKDDKQEKLVIATHTFEIWAEKWWKHWSFGKSERHARQTKTRLEQNIFPLLGKKPISTIEADDVVDVVKSIANRGALDLATRAHQTISAVFRYATAHSNESRCRANPASFLRPSDVVPTHRKQNYARVDIKELPQLLRDIDNSAATPVTRLALRLLALTFVRTSELIEAEWSEFDLIAHQWRIPALRMKMKTPHIVPLAAQTMELLTALKALTGHTKMLFPNQNDHSKAMSNNTILKALERMGYKGRMTGHGFRGVASTALHELGYDHAHIELQLAHQERNAVSAAYNHALYIQQRTELMQNWANYLDELKQGAKILQFSALP